MTGGGLTLSVDRPKINAKAKYTQIGIRIFVPSQHCARFHVPCIAAVSNWVFMTRVSTDFDRVSYFVVALRTFFSLP